MVNPTKLFGFLISMSLFALTSGAQQPSDQQHNHKQRADGVNERGDHEMGFSHEKTTHHFRLRPDGGSIEVTANDPGDSASQQQIKAHLSHIAKLFKEGDFSAPMLIHGETPPGVSDMKEFKNDISYTFETIDGGARVRIVSVQARAVEAIHAFLRYQIKDHRTGDPVEVDQKL